MVMKDGQSPDKRFDRSEFTDPYRALYLHIPFCKTRCAYCDFSSEALDANDPQIDYVLERLIRDIRKASRAGLLGDIETIYIGGGTPTHLGSRRLVNLIYTLSLSICFPENLEFTLEANPESVTPALARDLHALGVNRFSLGVQSFNDEELKALGRIHTAREALDAISSLQERCDNLSVDLMCGIPGQSLSSWEASLKVACEQKPTHLSIYPLTIEAGTPLEYKINQGKLLVSDEDLQAKMMLFAEDYLYGAGYKRYEVASYAQTPEHRSRHNIAYWTGVPYLGLGDHAASMRMTPLARERLLGGEIVETLTLSEAVLEDIMLGMRLVDGVSHEQIQKAAEQIPEVMQVFENLHTRGLIEETAKAYIPSRQGWLLGNELYEAIWNLANRAC